MAPFQFQFPYPMSSIEGRPKTTRTKKNAQKIPFDTLTSSESMARILGGVHPLSKFVHEDLIPRQLDVILLESINDFHARLTKSAFGFFGECRGLFLAPDHCWSGSGFQVANKALKKDYGVEMEGPTLLLPNENMRYWSVIHEGMHAVFHALPPSTKQQIVEAAVTAYPSNQDLYNMLKFTHLNGTSLDWSKTLKEVGEIMKKPGIESTKYGDLYILANTTERDQYMAVDEFIANFYANNRGYDRWEPRHFPSSFKSTLGNIGYNVVNPPEVEK